MNSSFSGLMFFFKQGKRSSVAIASIYILAGAFENKIALEIDFIPKQARRSVVCWLE